MRLFVAVWPPPDVRAALGRLERPPEPSVRWSTPELWHVTLRFFGEVAEPEVRDAAGSVREAAGSHPPCRAELGPATVRLGRGVLVVPVAGLDRLASVLGAATAGIGEPPPDRPPAGHVTVARGRGRRPVPAALAGSPVSAGWDVTEVALVRSHLGPAGPRYETLELARLGGPPR